jgi:hypothetical protein
LAEVRLGPLAVVVPAGHGSSFGLTDPPKRVVLGERPGSVIGLVLSFVKVAGAERGSDRTARADLFGHQSLPLVFD